MTATPRTTDAPGDAAVPMLAEQVMPLLVANCPGIQCKMVGACCYSRCHATQEIARKLDELAAARPVVALIARAATETYAGATEVQMLAQKGHALDRLIAAWDQLDHARALAARDGAGEAAAPPG